VGSEVVRARLSAGDTHFWRFRISQMISCLFRSGSVAGTVAPIFFNKKIPIATIQLKASVTASSHFQRTLIFRQRLGRTVIEHRAPGNPWLAFLTNSP
jgi:hypothetical protein